MSTSAGACGVWGIVLSEENVGERWMRRLATVPHHFDKKYDSEDDALEQFLPRIKAVLAQRGVVLPEGAYIAYTGSEDYRPGRCDTEAESFVVGLSIYMKPWQCPPCDESFTSIADRHTWIWVG